MEDTWAARDLPVLDAVVSLLDEDVMGAGPEGAEIAERARLPLDDVGAALLALKDEFLYLQTPGGGPGAWFVSRVTGDARRTVGQWPTGESLIDRLAAGVAEAAEREPDPERKRTLKAVAGGLGGMARAVAVNVATQMIEHKTGGRL